MNEYFSRSEFACQCGCGYDTVDAELLEVLTRVREHFGMAIHISSGARCAAHNKAIGGSPRSQHQYGRAADIVIKEVAPNIIFDYINALYPNEYGLGKYKTFTHLDTRGNKARWEGK